jgi:hypothetical protein
VEFIVLPVPPEAAAAVPVAEEELELEHAARAATVAIATAASLVHWDMRGLRTDVPLFAGLPEPAGLASFTWRVNPASPT